MGKKLLSTPKSRIRSVLRQLFLRSRERAVALKRDKYTCQKCGIKQTKAGKDKNKWVKVEVHHKHGILNWEQMFDLVYKFLLCSPDGLETLCEKCHKHEGE